MSKILKLLSDPELIHQAFALVMKAHSKFKVLEAEEKKAE